MIAISMGDPAGIGAEVILKAARMIGDTEARLLVVGDRAALEAAAERLSGAPRVREWHRGQRRTRGTIDVLASGQLKPPEYEPGRPSIAGADAAYRYIMQGARMVLGGEASALVTAPINKEWLNRAGHHFPGHSELLAKMSRTRRWRMMFAGGQMKVALVTVHMGLRQVSEALTRDGIFHTISLLAEHLRKQPGIARPRIAVLGFNPHAGENGLFGDEETRVIEPAIERARKAGIDARGPVAPDTAFIRPGGEFGFDGAVAMYHDQGLIALKTLEFDRAVNITLGLPFIRTSPDHGTAYDIAGQGVANAASMAAAIKYAAESARPRLAAWQSGGASGRRVAG
ncbi:MAG TPA: 4-hydroxythreonine-4-phosphate dehydrogenase PdxA [Candidatus Binataceae bacterium]|nr:4-hydroxythreonine-4-phosphate dehydrogenase PdxA [Candidatus Binataceae bacterium]